MELIKVLEVRFEQNKHRHENITWQEIEPKLTMQVLAKLQNLENANGEPDLIVFNNKLLYVDFSKESPAGRRSLCYDDAALNSRKENKPINSAVSMANAMGAQLVTEKEYYHMQTLEDIDLKTSSWIQTPTEIRKQGGALFCNKKYSRTFTGYNSAPSYYGVRGFRAKVEI